MSKPSPANVTARAERLIDAEWVTLRRDFMHNFNAQKTAAAKARAYGGSAYREAAHGLCADELHRRVSRTLDKLLETHSAMSAPPSDKHRRACKDWIADRTAREADDLQQHIFFPHPLSQAGGEFVPDTLHPESQRVIESANARLDSAFDQLQRNRMERAIRSCVRWGRIVGGFFAGLFGSSR